MPHDRFQVLIVPQDHYTRLHGPEVSSYANGCTYSTPSDPSRPKPLVLRSTISISTSLSFWPIQCSSPLFSIDLSSHLIPLNKHHFLVFSGSKHKDLNASIVLKTVSYYEPWNICKKLRRQGFSTRKHFHNQVPHFSSFSWAFLHNYNSVSRWLPIIAIATLQKKGSKKMLKRRLCG